MKATNAQLLDEIRMLQRASKAHEAGVWMVLSEKLARSKHSRVEVNLSRVSRYLREGEVAAVPGKVLGSGRPGKISVAAFSFSETAKRKVEEEGGICLTLRELVEKNPKGVGVRVIA